MSDREAEMTKNAMFILAKKELKLLFKSKRRIFILGITPLMILVIGVIAVTTMSSIDAPQNTQIWVINESPSNYSQSLVALYDSINNTDIVDYEGNFNEIVESGEFQIMVHIPSNFTTLMQNKQPAQISIAYNSNSSQYENVAFQMLQLTSLFEQQLVIIDNPDVEFDRIQFSLTTNPEEEEPGLTEEFASAIFIIPVYIMFFIVIPPISLIMISVTIEREEKTLETLFLQPVPRNSIIMGKIMYGIGLVVIVLLLDLIMVGIDVLLFSIFVDNQAEGDFAGIFDAIRDLIGLEIILYFLASIILLSVLVVALSVLLSLLAKDEREANLTSSVVPLILVSMIILVQAIELSSLPFIVQSIISMLPMVGILIALYLELISGSIGLIGLIGAVSQLVWIWITIRFAARLSESESILELNFQRIMTEIKNMILFR